MQELGIDRPVWAAVRGLDHARSCAGDLGKSYRYDLPAWQIIRPLIPVTIELAILSTIVAVVLGVPTGVISAVRQDTALDYALRVFSLAGLVDALVLARHGDHPRRWCRGSPGSRRSPTCRPTENFKLHAVQFLLPALAVGYRSSALIMRITRSALLEVMREDYIRTAWAKGQNERIGHLAARAQERDAAGGHRHRHRVRVPHRRPGGHRDGLQPARRRALPGAGDPLARLPGRAEPRHVHRHRRDPVEPGGGHAVRRPRPARALWPADHGRGPTTRTDAPWR